MKKYLIKYKQEFSPSYKVVNPYDKYDLRNIDDVILTHDGREYEELVDAQTKEIAKIVLAIRISNRFQTIGFPLETAISSVMNIVSITEVVSYE